MNITIIGSGNAGCAHAFKYSESGHRVTLVKTSNSLHEENYNTIIEQGGLWGIDNTNGSEKSFQAIYKVTRDIKDGLKDADIVIVLTQSLYHKDVAERICPFIPIHIKMILIIPGNMGSLIFRKYFKDRSVLIAEGESTPFDARIIEPGVVNILFKNKRNALAFLPANRSNEGLSLANKLVDTYKYVRENVVVSAMHNPNLIVHTVGAIMSASRIELMKGEFWMYRESFSPAIWNLIDRLDEEKNAIITKFKGEPLSYLDACKFRNEEDLTLNSKEVFDSYALEGGPKGPDSLDTRYLYEDVAIGLCLLVFLGKKIGIDTPVASSLVVIASSLVKHDFLNDSLLLDDLGIKDLDGEKLIELVNQ